MPSRGWHCCGSTATCTRASTRCSPPCILSCRRVGLSSLTIGRYRRTTIDLVILLRCCLTLLLQLFWCAADCAGTSGDPRLPRREEHQLADPIGESLRLCRSAPLPHVGPHRVLAKDDGARVTCVTPSRNHEPHQSFVSLSPCAYLFEQGGRNRHASWALHGHRRPRQTPRPYFWVLLPSA